MNLKKTGIRIVLLLILVLVTLSGCIDNKQADINSPEEAVITSIAVTDNTSLSVAEQLKIEPAKCELCHEDMNPRVNGGKPCTNCHGSQVHDIHIEPGIVALQCKSCHNFSPVVSKVNKGEAPRIYKVCEKCHAPPPD